MIGLTLTFTFLLILALVANALLAVRWQRRNTRGDAYFRRPIAERRAFRESVRRRSWLARPVLEIVAPFIRSRLFSMAPYQGIRAVGVACSKETFAFAHNYPPRSEDVFVATQMKCGTTWMQQIVYEAVCRGRGDLGDDGHRHLYAVSPWIESTGSVSMQDAPLVGETPTRIIKTHLPAQLCPYSKEARYVYVLRHPVSCFASCVDFLAGMGPISPKRADLLDWFCSEDMWWGPWPDHAEGWWRWRDRENVLFLHYEQMKKDLAGTVQQVSDFLALGLDANELAAVIEKSDYQWMKNREEWFEMHAPTLFSERGAFFNSGAGDRFKDASAEETQRIHQFCRDRLQGASYPLARFYSDVAEI